MHRRIILILFLSGLTLIAHNQTRCLDYYLKEGVFNSPLLNEYRNRLSSASSDSLLIKAARKPFVEAKSQLLYSPFYRNFGYDEVITDGGNYTTVLAITQSILNKSDLRNKLEGIDIQKKTINNSARISTTELNKIITDQYIVTFAGLNELTFNLSFLYLFRNEDDIVKQFVKNGVYKQTDYLALLVETQTQEILVNQLKSQYRKELMFLNQLCGITDTSLYELTDPGLTIIGVPDIARSPSYLQYKLDSLRIENEKTAIDIRYKPKVNWFADAGFLTHDPWNFYNHFGYSAGISLNIPVYDGKQRGIEKRKFDFDENSRKNYEIRFQKQYQMQIQQLNTDLKALNDISVSMEAQLNTTNQLVNALKNQLDAGIIQMTEYINAVKNLRTMTRNINLVKIQKLQVVNEMNFLMTQ